MHPIHVGAPQPNGGAAAPSRRPSMRGPGSSSLLPQHNSMNSQLHVALQRSMAQAYPKGGSRDGGRGQGRRRDEAPKRSGRDRSSGDSAAGTSTAPQQQLPVSEPVVPAVGWMWQTSRPRPAPAEPGIDGAAPSTSGRNGSFPTAMATVADLKENRIKAKKSLGQNFVTDDSVLLDIVAASNVHAGDVVIEVGPGTGNLTKHLLSKGARVTAIEKDDTLYGRLVEQYAGVPNLKLINGDILRVDIQGIINQAVREAAQAEAAAADSTPQHDDATPGASSPPSASSAAAAPHLAPRSAAAAAAIAELAGASKSGLSGAPAQAPQQQQQKVKVLSNLPYNITKDFLIQMMPMGETVSELQIMIQEEAARRLCERTPGGPEWRAMNLRTLYYCRPKYRFLISRFKYDPVPGVDGALVTFTLLPPAARLKVPSEKSFLSVVAKGFSERRKMLRNSLQPLATSAQVEASLSACGLRPEARAQDLSLDQFVALTWKLQEVVVAGLGLSDAAESAAAAEGEEGGGSSEESAGEEEEEL